MKRRLYAIWWSIAGYPDFPPLHLIGIMAPINRYTGKRYSPRWVEITNYYLNCQSLEKTAAHFNVTRERVRQLLWKAYRSTN